MIEYKIREARIDDAEALDSALRDLSAAIGDTHMAGPADLVRAGFGNNPSYRAIVAEGETGIGGVAVFSPMFSTVRGRAGIYVSDLWVSTTARGHGLGRRLLAAALDEGGRGWGAAFIKLAVYHDNSAARAFYEKLGFVESAHERNLVLSGPRLKALGEKGDESNPRPASGPA